MKRGVLAALALVVLALAVTPAALAWKPFTHVYSGEKAWNDVTADGKVSINGGEYEVDPTVVSALQAQRASYNAGVVGPDGFPDLVFGQSVIHPEKTGEWLRYLLDHAWKAQTDPAYNATQRQQILAFAYGYLTHAAGDLWAHTFVNDFAGGVFPGVSAILNGHDDPMYAVRHLIVEGYIGDANPGFDGNPGRTPVPAETNEDGDPEFSDDTSPAIAFAAPHEFLYRTLVDPNAVLPFGTCGDGIDDDHDGFADDGCPGGLYTKDGGPDLNDDGEPDGDGPEPKRGKLIDYFIDMKADLIVSLAEYDLDSKAEDCSVDCEGSETLTRVVDTPRGKVVARHVQDACGTVCIYDAADYTHDLTILNLIVEPYIEAWIDDIDTLLRHWSELGLASTRALFDPGTHRAAQNHVCRNKVGPDNADPLSQRVICEEGVGVTETLSFAADGFFSSYLLSALGAPDVAGDLLKALSTLSDLFDDVLGPAVNPIKAPLDALSEYVNTELEKGIGDALGIDIEQLRSFLTSPTHWLNIQSASFTLPLAGTQTVNFFDPNTHARLDALMNLPSGHHGPSETIHLPGVGDVTSARLADSTVFDETDFAAFFNTVQQAKLLLLRGPALNAVLRHELVAAGVVKFDAPIATYADGPTPTNIMFQQLGGTTSWLRTIDGDHQWRVDGMPRFCTMGTTGCVEGGAEPPTPRPERLNGGEGTYPLWESCINRPAFRRLYKDWENPGDPEGAFPALGDAVGYDSGDAAAPVPTIALSGTTFTSGSTTYVGGAHSFTLSAADAVFVDAKVAISYRYYKSGTTPAGWQPIANGGSFTIPTGAGDGLWTVELRAEDPCHTFAGGDALPDGATDTQEVFLDTTPPEITIISPAPEGVGFDTDDFSSIAWTVTDAGSGVNAATIAAAFDTAAAVQGQTLDMFYLGRGGHTVRVQAADNVGNEATATRLFEVHATAESLLNNVRRACGEAGAWPATPTLITNGGICTGMQAILRQAVEKHTGGNHTTEHKLVNAWVRDLEGQSGKAVDAATATRFIAYGLDLISRSG